MTWTGERIALLKTLWAEGLSGSQIAEKLGGVTRSAVIGKAHRIGLSKSGKLKGEATAQRVRRRKRRSAPRAAKPKTIAAIAKDTPAGPPVNDASIDLPQGDPSPGDPDPVKRLSVLELDETTCKWPIGDPGLPGFHFCGRRSGEGVPYCEHHYRVAYPEWMQALEAAE